MVEFSHSLAILSYFIHLLHNEHMKLKNKKIRDNQLELNLEKLFYHDESFLQEIKHFRNQFGLPEKGYETFDEYFDFMSDTKNAEDNSKLILYMQIESAMVNYSNKKGFPWNYSYYIESFLILGYKYKTFETRLPFHREREFSIYGPTCALDTRDIINDDRINLAIFPGASKRSILDFVEEHWKFIESSLKRRESTGGKVKSVRKSNKRDNDEIYARYKNGEFTSLGEWKPGIKNPEKRPKCLHKIYPERILKIITEQKRKEKLRNAI